MKSSRGLFGKNRIYVVKYTIAIIVSVITCVMIASVDFATLDSPLLYGFYLLPMMILSGLYSINIGTLSFAIVYGFEFWHHYDESYAMFGFAAMYVIVYYLTYREVFRSIAKSLLAWIAMTIAMSLFFYLTTDVTADAAITAGNLKGAVYYPLYCAIPTFVLVLFLYLMNTKCPAKLQYYFTALHLDFQKSRQFYYYSEDGKRYNRVMNIARVIMCLFAVILGVLVAILAVRLMSTLNRTDDVSGRVINIMYYGWKTQLNTIIIKLSFLMFCNSVIIVVLVDYALERWLIDPLVRLSSCFRDFAKSEGQDRWLVADKLKRIDGIYKDEIGELRDSLVDTTSEVLTYVDELYTNQLLKQDLRNVKAQSEAKTNFLSSMSHEIRTPINAIMGLNEMILRESQNPDILKYAKDIEQASSTLAALINDVLDFSKIEAGDIEIKCVEYGLSSMLNDIVNLVEPKAEEKGLELNVNVDDKIPNLLYGDEIRLKQCLTNLLSNACKYTMVGSINLDVSYEPVEDNIIFLKCSVADTGIGIKEADIEKMFQPFEKVDANSNKGGGGIGLSVVRKLLTMMDAELVIESRFGEGSTFSFELMQRVVKSNPVGAFNDNYNESIDSKHVYQEALHAPDARVLVVDDMKLNLTVMKGLLKEINLKLDTATSGIMALKMLSKKKYDLIFLDHRMPEMDGIEVLKNLREDKEGVNANTPCIALTANALSGAREEYIKEGFIDYLSKPVNSNKLEQMLIEHLPKRKVILPDSPEFAPTTHKTLGTSFLFDVDNPLVDARFAEVSGLDLKEGLENCAREEILIDAIKDFQANALDKAEKIEDLLAAQDYTNYTIEVHSLKSSARIIGASKLSEGAAYLEQCGNYIRNHDDTDVTLMDNGRDAISELHTLTPRMLNLLRSYDYRLAAFADISALQTFDERELISIEQLHDAYAGIREFVDAFDYESAESIIKMLEIYRIPDDEQEKYDIIKKLVGNIEREKLLEVLNG
ncbi:MAG: response regulator [Lachnospiraceae bacterium]|nr:response regulator [Lachnospiraceae bacterium]